MTLNFTLKRAKVMDDDDEIATVRGLSLNDMTDLIQINAEAMNQLLQQFQGRDPNGTTAEEVSRVGYNLLKNAPLPVAQIIATGADTYDGYVEVDNEPTPTELIMVMPTGAQMACLENR